MSLQPDIFEGDEYEIEIGDRPQDEPESEGSPTKYKRQSNKLVALFAVCFLDLS